MIRDKIIIVEDDPSICQFLTTTLTANSYDVVLANSGKDALDMIASHCPDVILLDLGLPDMDGNDVIRRLRSWTRTPIIVLSARSAEIDKAAALDLGADDYLTKPFSVDELLARLRVALRRVRHDRQRLSEESSVYENGGLRIDYAAGCVYLDGSEIHLTPIEFKLLVLLANNTGKVLTHNYILREVWGNPAASDMRSLRVYMATLRKKLEKNTSEPKYIQTHIGVGYRMLRNQ